MMWKGPYDVVECIAATDYRIQFGSHSKVFHINMLKRYFERDVSGSETDHTGQGESHEIPLE